MSVPALHQNDEGVFHLEGQLTFASVPALVASFDHISGKENVDVDLAGVTDVDSAAAALLLQWKRTLLRQSCDIHYHSLPVHLLDLLQLYEVDQLLLDSLAS